MLHLLIIIYSIGVCDLIKKKVLECVIVPKTILKKILNKDLYVPVKIKKELYCYEIN